MRVIKNINSGWRFIRKNVNQSEVLTVKSRKVNLPHTWNNLDGQDGGGDFYRGTCWYYKKLGKLTKNNDEVIYLEFEGDVRKDKYDRHLAYIWYKNSEGKYLLYNEEIVRIGLAKIAYIFSQTRYLNRLLSAQDEARAKKLNIWSIKGYVINHSFNMEVVGDNNTKVYISRSNQSKLYHKFKDIHNLKNTKSMSLFEARKLRYSPCKKCFK